jgi:hypothetical protein
LGIYVFNTIDYNYVSSLNISVKNSEKLYLTINHFLGKNQSKILIINAITMKKTIVYFCILFCAGTLFAQNRGIAYQAVLFPKSQKLPGVPNSTLPLAKTSVCLRFSILDGMGTVEYQENVSTNTDDFGMVNLYIGNAPQIGGYASSFNGIVWSADRKNLKVELDMSNSCTNFEEISNQLLSSVPYSFNSTTATTADNVTGVVGLANGGTGASTLSGALTNLGLNNVDNTSDANKPISVATKAALNTKEDVTNKSTDVVADAASDSKYPTVKALKTYVDSHSATGVITDGSITDVKIANGINPSKVGLGNVDNTSDLNKPISIATQTALNLKEDAANKSTAITLGTSDILFPTQKAVKTYVDAQIASAGVIDGSITTVKLADASVTNAKLAELISVPNGGTGAASLTGYVIGNGTNAMTSTNTIPVADVAGAVRKVNGNLPNAAGEVVLSFGTTYTGTISNRNTVIGSPVNGDIYVVSGDLTPSNNGLTYIYDGTNWNEITVNQASLDARYLALAGGTMQGNITVPAGKKIIVTDAPTNTTDVVNKAYVDSTVLSGAPDANATTKGKVQLAGDLAGSGSLAAAPIVGGIQGVPVATTTPTTGQILYFNGTSWAPTSAPAETDGIVGNEVTDVVANGGLTRSGTGTAADPYKLKINDGTANGQILVWDGAKWVAQAVPAETDGIIGNEVADAVANGGLTRSGTGTAADPYKLKINDGTANGQILVWDGAKWVAQAAPAETDGIIGNEVADAVANGGLTRSGTGTAADPYKLKINDGTANGQILVWDGAKWVAQAASTDWNIAGNAGTTAGTNFVGTTDAVDFVTKTNNTEVMRVTSTGNVGIGINNPTSKLQTNGSFAVPFTTTATAITLDGTQATVQVDASAADVNITLPAANTAKGRIYTVIKSDLSNNKLIFSTAIKINGGSTFTQANVTGKYQLQSNGTDWILLN